MIRVRVSATFVIAAALTTWVAAQQPSLNLKPGLWEMTVRIDMGGSVPGVDTSKMTPQQRAQMEAMMASAVAKPTVVQSCVTKEDLAQARVQKDPPGSSCTTKITKATATVVDVTQTCTGASAGVREMHTEALSPESMKMVSKAVSGRGAGTTVNMTGKWLGAACGNVK